MSNQTFLGSGWAFPPHFEPGTRTAAMSHNEQNVHQSLRLLLGTQLGERILEPNFGTTLKAQAFAAYDAELAALLKEAVEEAILAHEPRIAIDAITVSPNENEEGCVNIALAYHIPESNNRFNFVYPFYLIEGTNLPEHVKP